MYVEFLELFENVILYNVKAEIVKGLQKSNTSFEYISFSPYQPNTFLSTGSSSATIQILRISLT